MLWQERCGKRQGLRSGTSDIIPDSLGYPSFLFLLPRHAQLPWFSLIQQISCLVSIFVQMLLSQFARTLTTNLLVRTLSLVCNCQLLIVVDARWFTRTEVQAVLKHSIGTTFGSEEYTKMAEHTEGRNNQDPTATQDLKIEGPPFKLPPVTAIAGVLIRDWAEGNIGFSPCEAGPAQPLQRGHL
jgi:hypothetical protein